MKISQRDVNLANILLRQALEMQRFAQQLTDPTMPNRHTFPSVPELHAVESQILDAAYAVRYYRNKMGGPNVQR